MSSMAGKRKPSSPDFIDECTPDPDLDPAFSPRNNILGMGNDDDDNQSLNSMNIKDSAQIRAPPTRRRRNIYTESTSVLADQISSDQASSVGVGIEGNNLNPSASSNNNSSAFSSGENTLCYPKDERTREFLIKSLKDCYLFDTLNISVLNKIVSLLRPRKVLAQEYVFHQEEDGDYLYFVQEGRLDVRTRFSILTGGSSISASRSQSVSSDSIVQSTSIGRKYNPGEWFGELSLCHARKRAASIVAEVDCTLWMLDRLTFRSFCLHAWESTFQTTANKLRSIKLLAPLTNDQIKDVAQVARISDYQPGEVIFHQGEAGLSFYIIVSGKVKVETSKVLVEDPNTKLAGSRNGSAASGQSVMEHITVLKEGDFFGELALLTENPRLATVTAIESLTLIVIDKSSFINILGPIREVLDDNIRAFALQKISIFDGLSMEQRIEAFKMFKVTTFPKGQVIMNEGDEGDKLYILRSGKVRVTMTTQISADRIETTHLDDLEVGSYFGEMALLYQQKRTATVTALENCECFYLQREDFQKISGETLQRLSDEAKKRNDQDLQIKSFLSKVHHRKSQDGPVAFAQPQGTNPYWSASGNVLGQAGFVPHIQTQPTDMQAMYANYLQQISQQGTYAPSSAFPTFPQQYATQNARYPAGQNAHPHGYAGMPQFFTQQHAPTQADGTISTAQMQHTARQRQLQQGPQQLQTVQPYHVEPDHPRFTNYDMNYLTSLRTLGTGSFGRVKLVISQQSQCTYALKIQSKSQLMKFNLRGNVFNEKEILMRMNHPFIAKLYQTFQDRDYLYMLMELIQGGELFSFLQHYGQSLRPEHRMFYISCVLSAFEALHAVDVVYRDLKPENLMINPNGYLKLVDFGFAKIISRRTYTFCGTPEYFSPELVLGKGYGKGNDVWALGILAYELMIGSTPFGNNDEPQTQLYRRIVRSTLEFPRGITDIWSKDLITKLLEKDVTLRFGCGRHGIKEVKDHALFSGLDWHLLLSQSIRSPWRPKLKSPTDASNFDAYDENYERISFHCDVDGDPFLGF